MCIFVCKIILLLTLGVFTAMYLSDVSILSPEEDDLGCDNGCENEICSPDPASHASCCSLNPIIRNQVDQIKKMAGSKGTPCIPNLGSMYVGAKVVSTRDTKNYKHPQGTPSSALTNKPQLVIEGSTVTIGKNWHFTGVGRLVIKLFNPCQISAFSIIHPPRCQIPLGFEASAPKNFLVMGLESLEETYPFLFGNFTYNLEGPSIQIFPVQFCSKDKYELIEFVFLSNYGNLEYTSLYKIEIHGDLGEPPFMRTTSS